MPHLLSHRPPGIATAAIAAVLALAALLLAPPASAQAPAVRVTAPDPVALGVALSQHVFAEAGAPVPGATAVHAILGRDDDFADSLAAGPLLGGGPLLYVPGGEAGTLPDVVAAELQRVLPPGSIVYIAGGTAAVGPEVAAAVEGLGFLTIRLAGEERTATAVAIAREISLLSGPPDVVLLALATSWPDAVAGAARAASGAHPILLTGGDVLAEPTAAFLTEHPDAEVWVLGGDAVITDATASAAGMDRRLAGPTRVDTAVAVAQAFPEDVRGTTLAQGYVDTGWVEANAGAASLQPLLLVGPSPDDLPAVVAGALAGRDGELLILGGSDRISDAAVIQAEEAR